MKVFTGIVGAAAMISLAVLGVSQADAACSPASGPGSPAPGTTVTCSGANPATYGDFTQNGLTINVQSGASVSSTTADAMDLGANNAVNNSGTIQTTAASQGAIFASGALSVVNSGTIGGGGPGITSAGSLSVVNTASGTIAGVGNSAIIGTSDVNVTNAGLIAGGIHGVTGVNLTNTGTIVSLALTAVGSDSGATINNSGLISNTGGFAISVTGAGQIINSGTIVASTVAIEFVGAGSSLTNSGTIGGVINFDGPGNTLTLLPGSNIPGDVHGFGSDTFQLGGTGNATFDTSALGAQYTGFSTFNKIGTSTWMLTGNGGTGVAWNVNSGTLLASGSILSPFTVNAGGTLGGTGTVGNTFVNGGTLSPGNSLASLTTIGTLTVQGNLVFTATGNYLVEVSPSTADRTNVTGTAALGGATVNASFAPGSYVVKQYTILNAGGGVSGTFGPVVNTNLPSGFRSSLSYDANDVYLNLSFALAQYSGLSTNQQNVANTLTNYFNATGGIPAVFGSLTPAGLTQVSGELATGSQQTTFDAMTMFMGLMTDPFGTGRGSATPAASPTSQFADEGGAAARAQSALERDAYAMMTKAAPAAASFEQRWNVWAASYGGSRTTNGNDSLGSNRTTDRVFGMAVGASYLLSPNTLAGFAVAGGGTNFSVANGGTGRSDLFQAGVFIKHTAGPAYVLGALAYGWQDITTDRTVTVAGSDQLRARFNANAFSGRLEGGYRFATPWLGVTPYAAGQFINVALPAYAEQVVSGANTFALSYGAKTATASRSELGLRADKSYALTNAILMLRGRAAWAHDFNTDRTAAAAFQTLPTTSFIVNGAAQASDAALTTASAEVRWINGFSLAATFEGEFSSVTRSYAGKGVARYTW
jgi:uncharacterized protein with beta-barrel porin domain